MDEHKHILAPLALLLLAVGAVYFPALGGPFVFDDIGNIVENPAITDARGPLELASPASAASPDLDRFTVSRSVGYRSFRLNYALWGPSPLAFRATNVAVHAASTISLFLLVLALFRAPALASARPAIQPRTIALAAAALFALHPVQTGAVSYIVQRFASLATLFVILSLLLYLCARLSGGRAARVLCLLMALATALLAMRTKEIAVTLPILVLLVETVFFRGPWRARAAFVVPMLLTVAVIPVTMIAQSPGGMDLRQILVSASSDLDPGSEGHITRVVYLMTSLRVFLTYLRLLALPMGQNFDYYYPLYPGGIGAVQSMAGLCAFTAMAAMALVLAIQARRSHPLRALPAFGIAWFLITLIPETSLIPIEDVIFEHRLYLPWAGLALALPGAALTVAALRPALRPALAVTLGIALISLASLTASRNAMYSSELALMRDTAMKSPGKTRPLNNLAGIYMRLGRDADALAALEAALALEPRGTDALYNLGWYYAERGRWDEAIAYYEKANALGPGVPRTLVNLGSAYERVGRWDEAARLYSEAGAISPRDPIPGRNLDRLRPALAIRDELLAQIEADPGDRDAYYNLGVLYYSVAAYAPARDAFLHAVSLVPSDHEAWNNLGATYLKLGSTAAARAAFSQALSLDPSNPDYAANLRALP